MMGSSRLKELLAYTSGTFPNIKHLDARRAVLLHRSLCDSSKTTEQPIEERSKWNQNIQVEIMG